MFNYLSEDNLLKYGTEIITKINTFSPQSEIIDRHVGINLTCALKFPLNTFRYFLGGKFYTHK